MHEFLEIEARQIFTVSCGVNGRKCRDKYLPFNISLLNGEELNIFLGPYSENNPFIIKRFEEAYLYLKKPAFEERFPKFLSTHLSYECMDYVPFWGSSPLEYLLMNKDRAKMQNGTELLESPLEKPWRGTSQNSASLWK